MFYLPQGKEDVMDEVGNNKNILTIFKSIPVPLIFLST
jgi:hypothetical protein